MSNLTVDEARAVLDALRHDVDQLVAHVQRLFDGKGWIALGYMSWSELAQAELRPILALPKSERIKVMLELQEAGMSDRAVADAVGVSNQTVRRSTGTNVPVGRKTTGRDGKKRSRAKGKPHEIKARRQHVKELFEAGYTRAAMVACLDCAQGTIDTDLAALGCKLSERTMPLITTAPPVRQWRDKPKPRPVPTLVEDDPPRVRSTEPRHRRYGSLLQRLQEWQSLYDEERWALRACHHVDSAVACDDTEWLDELRATVRQLRVDLDRIDRVVIDPMFRDAQSRVGDGSPPAEVPRHLRGVQ
jgi:transposase